MGFNGEPELPLSIIVVPALVMFIVIVSVLDLASVQGSSMAPVLDEGQTVFVYRLAYGLQLPFVNIYLLHWDKPKKHDIIVFRSPLDNRLAVKRVVGTTGDEIVVGDAVVLVGGEAYDVPGPVADTLKLTPRIPDSKVFVVGDNRANSTDSRHYGLVDITSVRGRLFPFRSAHRTGNAE
jgi:signal peptidase I